MDVPEDMRRSASYGSEGQVTSEQLLTLVHVPLKMLQLLSEGISAAYNTQHLSSKRRLEGLDKVGTEGINLNKRTRLGERSISGTYESKGVEEEKEARHLKAVKNDNAQVPMELWEEYLLCPFPHQAELIAHPGWIKAMKVFQQLGLQRWRRDKLRSYVQWKRKNQDKPVEFLAQAHEAAREALERATLATWWDWPNGSRPFFWNWPEEVQTEVMLGLKWWLRKGFVPFKKKQRILRDLVTHSLVKEKLEIIREKGYVAPGKVTALMFFFDVQKGTDDIRMVYDGTASGLNDSLWCPWFLLPTIDSLLRCVEPGTFMCDNDIGEMFLNFMLHEDMRQLCGIDVGGFFPEEAKAQGGQVIIRWARNAMGLRPSPYTCVKFILLGHEVIMGNPNDPENVFQWVSIRLNLPGDPLYDPSVPWVSKKRSLDT